jgi:Ser/Thr protein kinase RdoA (MazF antagonist)
MKTTPTPPDMTKEQVKELGQLRARLAKLARSVARDKARDLKDIAAIERKIARNRTALMREAERKQKDFARSFKTELTQLRTGLRQHNNGTSATQKECASITKRIAVLKGRLAS